MILRRITEHVKAQNWTAVALDFLIVVVGVFIGLQVQQWTVERERRASEQRYLIRLHGEFRGIGQRHDRGGLHGGIGVAVDVVSSLVTDGSKQLGLATVHVGPGQDRPDRAHDRFREPGALEETDPVQSPMQGAERLLQILSRGWPGGASTPRKRGRVQLLVRRCGNKDLVGQNQKGLGQIQT